MTRKEELRKQAQELVLAINEIQPEQWDGMDERDCKLILDTLQQVEREVWNRAASHFHKVSFLYGNDSWRERSAVKECANWCRDQQQELA